MGSGEGILHWSMFDGVKHISTTPESVMTEINSAIFVNEYARATALFRDGTVLVSDVWKIFRILILGWYSLWFQKFENYSDFSKKKKISVLQLSELFNFF